MGKIIRLTESNFASLIKKVAKRVVTEQQYITTKTVKPVSLPPIEIPYKFKAGFWKPTTQLEKLIVSKLNPVLDFIKKYQNQKIEIMIRAMESQVTNYDNEPSSPNKGKEVAPRYLATNRANSVKSILQTYFSNLKSTGVISVEPKYVENEILIGPTKYKKGVDDPNNSKYAEEQRIDLIVSATGEAVSEETTCLVGMKIKIEYDPRYCRPSSNEKDDSRCHGCNQAEFSIYANGVPIQGKGYGGFNDGKLTNVANLNNGIMGGGDKMATGWVSEFTDETAKQVLKDNDYITFTYQCESKPDCHSDSLLVTILDKNNKQIWKGFVSGGARISKSDGQRLLMRTNKCGLFLEGAAFIGKDDLAAERAEEQKLAKTEIDNKNKGLKPRTVFSTPYYEDEDASERTDNLSFVYAAVDKNGRINYRLLLDPVYDKEELLNDPKILPTWKDYVKWAMSDLGATQEEVNQAMNSKKYKGKLPMKPAREYYR